MPLPWAATVFSIGLRIGNEDILHFNNIQISYSADGTGTKGIISQQLTFNLPACEYGDTAGVFPYGTAVHVTAGMMTLPTFYIYGRKPNGVNIAMTCYDCVMFTKETSTLKETFEALSSEPAGWSTSYKNYYTKSGDNYSKVSGSSAPTWVSGKYYRQASSYIDRDGNISLNTVIENICHICGLSSVNTGEVINTGIPKIPKDNVIGKSAREILSGLAEAACGCFFAQVGSAKTLAFLPFASNAFSASFHADKYDRVNYGLSKTCSGIIITDGSRAYSYGGGSDVYHIMQINTVYASPQLAGAVISSLREKVYTAWSCQNALVTAYPAPGAGITFGDNDTELVCNYCRIRITAGGCFASLGRNDVSESEYSSEYARGLFERVKIGEINGNTKMTRDGVKFIYVNENARSGSTVEEYGFKTDAGGMTTYDGVMMDGVMPTEIESVSDTEKRIKYGGKTYKLTFDVVGGKKTNIKYEEVEE